MYRPVIPKTTPIFVLFILFSTLTWSQSAPYHFYNYNTEEGLSHNKINDIIQDQNGFIWIGTTYGLNRYDGYTFTTFYYDVEDSLSLSSNEITVLYEDEVGRLWVGTANGGLNRYQQSEGHFVRYPFTENTMGYITDIAAKGDGSLLVGTQSRGVLLFDPENPTDCQQIWPQKGSEEALRDKDAVHCLLIGADGELWIGSGSGVFLYDFNSEDNIPKASITETLDAFFSEQTFIHSLYQTNDKKIWLGTSRGLFVVEFPPPKKDFQRDSPLVQLVNIEPPKKMDDMGVVLEMTEDPNGNLWMGTQSGLVYFEVASGRWTFLRPDKTSRHALAGSGNRALLIDRFSMVWIGTDNGISTLHPNSLKFNQGNRQQALPPGLEPTGIREIYKVNDYFFFSSNQGFFAVREYGDRTFAHQKLLDGDFTALHYDQEKYLYLGTVGPQSYYRFNVETLEPQPLNKTANHQDRQKLKGFTILDFAIDHLGKQWIAALGGLNRFDPNSGVFDPFYRIDLPGGSFVNLAESCELLLDRKHNLWIATTSGLALLPRTELEKFPETNLDFKAIQANVEKRQSLNSNVVQTIFESKDGVIWVGTNSGLHEASFDGESLHLRYQNLSISGPEPSITVILEDDRGNLWISTSNAGLFRYTPSNEEVWRLTAKDGIFSNTFQTNSFPFEKALKDNSGQMIFLNDKTLLSFFPDSIQKNDIEPPIFLTELSLAGKSGIEVRNDLLYRPIREDDRLVVRPDQHMIRMQFTGLNFLNQEETTYAYRLLGLDDSYIDQGTKREITLINLSPKNYELEIIAWNNDGVKTQKSLKLQIQVRPPFYRTNLAYCIYLFLLGGIIYSLFQYQSKRKDAQRLKELDKIKTRLYTNITHEFRTPLTIILGMADKMRDDQQKWRNNDLDMIRRNGRQLLKLINQLLDLTKLEAGKMEIDFLQKDILPFLRYNIEAYHSLASAKDIRLHTLTGEEPIMMDYDPEKIKCIVSNLISNAIKYTGAGGSVLFKVEKVKSWLEMKVIDTGVGIPKDQLPYIFDRFHQVDGSHTRKSEGTGIGLALTMELVRLLGGTIEVESKFAEGSTFTVRLPITNNAPLTDKTIDRAEQNNLVTKPLPFPKSDNNLPLGLIIEDNADVVQYLISCLKTHYQLEVAYNGKEGLQKAFEIVPDFIISDVMMPELDGFELCGILKKDKRTSHIPIVLLTAKADQQSRIEGLKFGADTYLVKPFNKKELFVQIDKLLELRQKLKAYYSSLDSSLYGESEKHLHYPLEGSFLQEVHDLIMENLLDKELSVNMLCELLYISRTQLHRKIKALTGLSTTKFINNVRLREAEKLLITTNLPIKEVAYQAGFNSPDYFRRLFYESYNCSPSRYREDQLSKS